jgi:hypothetical protein
MPSLHTAARTCSDHDHGGGNQADSGYQRSYANVGKMRPGGPFTLDCRRKDSKGRVRLQTGAQWAQVGLAVPSQQVHGGFLRVCRRSDGGGREAGRQGCTCARPRRVFVAVRSAGDTLRASRRYTPVAPPPSAPCLQDCAGVVPTRRLQGRPDRGSAALATARRRLFRAPPRAERGCPRQPGRLRDTPNARRPEKPPPEPKMGGRCSGPSGDFGGRRALGVSRPLQDLLRHPRSARRGARRTFPSAGNHGPIRLRAAPSAG